jgi:beta-lactamase class A
MDARGLLDDLALTGAGYAAPVAGHTGVGVNADDLVTPASVMKIQVALTIENAIGAGAIDGTEQRVLTPERRTPGPVGISLMHDEVSMSVRDLVVSMLTISDNVATDELLALAGLERVNRTTHELGLVRTRITSTLRDMLDGMAAEVGFPSYAALVAHDPDLAGPPSVDEIRSRLADTAALDPTRGTRTTAAETVLLLQAIWRDRAGDARTCRLVRQLMGQQLTRHRIASGFGPPITVAAKSGGLLGIVRNEAGVVTFPDGAAYAVAVFTRRTTETTTDPALIDAGIGRIARALIDRLRES